MKLERYKKNGEEGKTRYERRKEEKTERERQKQQ